MKLISLLAVLCLMYSCEEKRVSPKMELRQMQYSQNKDEVTKGTFFFIGSFSKQKQLKNSKYEYLLKKRECILFTS